MKRFLWVPLALILSVAIVLPALAVTIDHPPVQIDTRRGRGAFSLTVEDLPETFAVNLERTPDLLSEYVCRVKFCDGSAFYSIGAIHFKEPNGEPRISELFDSCLLYREDVKGASYVTDSYADRKGDTVTFFLEDPMVDIYGNPVKIDFENIIAFGYQVQNLVGDKQGSINTFFRILDDGEIEEITREAYFELVP